MDELKIENRLSKVEERAKSNTNRLDDVEKRLDENDKLVQAVCGLQKDMEYTKDSVQEIKEDVKILTEKPGKRWDSAIEKVIFAIIAAVVGFALAKVGLG